VLRRRGERPAEADSGRWLPLFRAAAAGQGDAADALLDELRAAAGRGGAQDRKAALEELLAAPPRLWIALDRRARAGAASRGNGPGEEPGEDADPLRLLLASFDADGRVRQAAVERLARRSGRHAACALALRTDDWVPAVRETALRALLAHVAPDEAAAAVRMLARLAGRGRAGEVLERYRAVLREPERRRTVRRLAAEPDPHARRFGVELALELGEYVRGDLARTALHDRDQDCRRLCAQRLLELDPDQAGRLMWARSAAVRELAVAALPDDVPAVRLVAPLADRSRMVRAQARWKLYKRGEPPVEVYRRQLRRCGRSTQSRLVAGLAAGLGECGDVSDLPMLAVLAEDASWPPVARRAAVRALGRLVAAADPRARSGAPGTYGGGEMARTLARLAADPVPSVAREALDALAATGSARPETLRAALESPEPQLRRAALRAARGVEFFDHLELLLRAARDPRPEIAARARAAIREWPRRQWAGAPHPGQLPRLGGLLRQSGLPEAERAPVEFVLRAAGRGR
jgi:hypothetical protein